ncbi:MAG: hypothetical protein WDM96_05455 [Lacunisphaera sp.]
MVDEEVGRAPEPAETHEGAGKEAEGGDNGGIGKELGHERAGLAEGAEAGEFVELGLLGAQAFQAVRGAGFFLELG